MCFDRSIDDGRTERHGIDGDMIPCKTGEWDRNMLLVQSQTMLRMTFICES